jgi:hypothetical protein
MDQKKLVQLISDSPFANEITAVFPARNFEIDNLDSNRLTLTVHFYPSEDAFRADKSLHLMFLLPRSGARDLAQMLKSATDSM